MDNILNDLKLIEEFNAMIQSKYELGTEEWHLLESIDDTIFTQIGRAEHMEKER